MVLAKNFRGLDGQGAVHVDGNSFGKLAFLVEQEQGVDNFLGAFHGKGRDDGFSALFRGVADGRGQFIAAGVLVFVIAVAVRGLQKKIVSGHGRLRGIVHEQGVGPAQIA